MSLTAEEAREQSTTNRDRILTELWEQDFPKCEEAIQDAIDKGEYSAACEVQDYRIVDKLIQHYQDNGYTITTLNSNKIGIYW